MPEEGASPSPAKVEPTASPSPAPAPAPAPTKPPLDPEEAEKQRLVTAYGATGLTALLFFASFHPIDAGNLAYVCLVPWLFVALRETRRAAMVMSYAVMFLAHVVGLAWIALTTSPGWLVTSFLEGFYSLAICLVVRRIRHRLDWPVTFVLPPLWVAGEYSRGAHLWFIKFPWLLLGQTQHAHTNLVQIADLASVYGISFLVVMVNGWLVDVLLCWDARRSMKGVIEPSDIKRLAKLGAWPLGLLVLANVYGLARTKHVEANVIDGPRLLAVQIDVPQDLESGDRKATAQELADMSFNLTRAALAGLKENDLPDAIVWSETSWAWPLNVRYPDFAAFDHYVVEPFNRVYPATDRHPAEGDVLRAKTRELFRLVEQDRCDLLVGAMDHGTFETLFTKNAVMHNSFYQISPGANGTASVEERYDKCNLVPASEGIPGKDHWAFFWFYDLIKSFVPPGFVTFEAGKGPRLMTLAKEPHWKLSPDICFEVSFPELLSEGVRQGADVLVCPSNDGWFHTKYNLASAEVDLALDHAQLRAIETRRGMVRVVNRGVTCFLDPLGNKAVDPRDHRVMEVTGTAHTSTGERVPSSNLHVEGTILGTVPTTRLTTLYLIVGDLFAWLTWIASALLIGATFKPELFRRVVTKP